MAEPDLYRNRDFIPDFDALMAETEARSRAFAETVQVERDIPYGPSPRQRYDLVYPPGRLRDAPLHIFVHGGYWRAGDKAVHTAVAAPVVAAGGIAALVSYDLMPGTRLDAIVAQVRDAARQLHTRAPELGADPDRLTASGHSAGAHLVSLLAAQAPGETTPPALPPFGALLMVSGIYDLSGIPDSFLKHEAEMRPDEAEAWSPATARHIEGPRRIFTRGSAETAPFHDQPTALAARLKAEGQPVELREEADRNHLSVVLDLADPDAPLGRRLADMVADS